MGPTRNYHRMALECLELAESARDPASQDMLIRMAELWASLADRAEHRAEEKAERGAAA
jgi:hypothetical protein